MTSVPSINAERQFQLPNYSSVLVDDTTARTFNLTNVPSDPEKNMKAAEDFLLLLVHTHIVVAANHILLLNPTESQQHLADWIIVNFATLPEFNDLEHVIQDSVTAYATEVLSLAYFGMYFMMQFVKKMGKDSFDIGIFWLCCHNIPTVQNKRLTCYSCITTSFRT